MYCHFQQLCKSINSNNSYLDTSHGKLKSDGLSGVVKCFSTRYVSAKGVVNRNTKDIYDYFLENLTVVENNEDKSMLSQIIFFISGNKLEEYRSKISENQIKRTR